MEEEKRAGEREQLADDRAPLHPLRVYAELGEVLDRDAIVICDGGDFASYAGRAIESYEPGCWLDPGPFGCLGCGPGYALAAKLARPERQVVLLLGDGAFGFSGMEWDTLARHGVGVVGVMGNNGIWGLEKHPMEFLYGYSVVADLRPGDALRPRRRGARRPRRAGARAGRAQARAGARAGGRRAGARERADGPVGRVSAIGEPRLKTRSRLAAGRGGFKLAPSGRAGVRALGAVVTTQAAGGAVFHAAIARIYVSGDDGGRHDRPYRRDEYPSGVNGRHRTNV